MLTKKQAMVALLGLAACSNKAESTKASGAEAASPPAAPTQLVDAFEVSLSSNVTINGQQLLADVTGTLAVSPEWKDSTGAWRTLQLTPTKVALRAGQQQQTELAGLQQPFWVRIDERGTLRELALSKGLPAESRRVQQAIAGFLQVSCPLQAGAPSWRVEEEDVSGKHQVEYTQTDAEWLGKRKLEYADTGAVKLAVERSQVNYRGRCGQFPSEVAATESLRGAQVGMLAETTFSLRPRARSPLALSGIGRFLPGAERVAPSAVARLTTPPLPKGEQVSFQAALAKLAPEPDSIFDRKTLRGVLAHLADHPQDLALVAADYRQVEQHRHATARLLAALDTPEGSATIASLLDDGGLSQGARIELLTALLFAARVDARVIESVHALGRNKLEALAAVAVNTEGSLLKQARDSGDPAAPPLIERYFAAWSSQQHERVQAAYLQGFAYLGSEQMLAVLQQAALSPVEALRVAALSALECVKDERADTWVLDRLSKDSSAVVRERAVRACSYRASLPCGKAVARALVSDRDRRVRLRALEVFAQAGNPAVTFTLLERVSRRDADAGVRRAAREALARLRQQAAASKEPIAAASAHEPGRRAGSQLAQDSTN